MRKPLKKPLGSISPSLRLVARPHGVLVLQQNPPSDGPVFGPTDLLTIGPTTQTAAAWTARLARFASGETRQLARQYLAQWPHGPQL